MNYDRQFQTHFLLIDDSFSIKNVNLVNSVYSIGRHSGNSIKLNSPEISRHHATLIRKDLPNGQFTYFIIDGDLHGKRSQNGIIVNGKKVLYHRLKHKDTILLGTESIKIIYHQKKSNADVEDIEGTTVETEIALTDENPKSEQSLEKALILSERNFYGNLPQTQDENLENLEVLASFPELSPYPIVEFNFNNQITYLNHAAQFYFESLEGNITLEHPFINGLSCSVEPLNQQINVREIKIQDRYFEQSIHYLSTFNRIRCYFFDITERKKSAEKLQYHLFHDYLTGIDNRESFYWYLAKSLSEVKKQQEKLAIIFIDIDRFKNINDSLNHSTGDKLLESFVDRISSQLPQQCFFARWGSDEFTIIISPLADYQQIEKVVKLITDCLQQPFK